MINEDKFMSRAVKHLADEEALQVRLGPAMEQRNRLNQAIADLQVQLATTRAAKAELEEIAEIKLVDAMEADLYDIRERLQDEVKDRAVRAKREQQRMTKLAAEVQAADAPETDPEDTKEPDEDPEE